MDVIKQIRELLNHEDILSRDRLEDLLDQLEDVKCCDECDESLHRICDECDKHLCENCSFTCECDAVVCKKHTVTFFEDTGESYKRRECKECFAETNARYKANWHGNEMERWTFE